MINRVFEQLVENASEKRSRKYAKNLSSALAGELTNGYFRNDEFILNIGFAPPGMTIKRFTDTVGNLIIESLTESAQQDDRFYYNVGQTAIENMREKDFNFTDITTFPVPSRKTYVVIGHADQQKLEGFA